MGFTTSCFIRKNTPELRSKLKELGYDICCCTEFKDACWLNTFLLDKEHSVHGVGYLDEVEPLPLEKRLQCFLEDNARSEHPDIDCGENEQMFLALAAMRDDSDINQYFICDKVSITLGKTYYSGDYLYYQYDEFFDKQNWHKATVEEIIEHFKR